jgi:hypothetical protein
MGSHLCGSDDHAVCSRERRERYGMNTTFGHDDNLCILLDVSTFCLRYGSIIFEIGSQAVSCVRRCMID